MRTKNKVGSPSARRRERIRGRWMYHANLDVGNERTIHHAKQVIGFLIPWLMVSLPIFLATSRAATEIASWGLAALTLFYIGVDALAEHREFKFFRLGPDVALAACLGFGLLSVAASTLNAASTSDLANLLLEGLGHLRWIPLLYLFAYAWELFPGLNRVITALVGTVTVIATLAWIQHFQGLDWLTSEALTAAPTGSLPYFVPRGFFGSTEALATLFACVLPFPIAAAFLRRERGESDKTLRWIGGVITAIISLGLVFTYRPEFWGAGLAGAAALILPGSRRLKHILYTTAAIAAVWLILTFAFDFSVDAGDTRTIGDRIRAEEQARTDQHRLQMNGLIKVWEESPILGIAGATPDMKIETTGTGARYESINIYFLILARSGLIGLALYLVFVIHHLWNTLRLFDEIPASHHRHRVLVAGCFASQCAFHVAGLYWGTMTEAFSMNLFVLVSSMTLYMTQHYTHGLVPDDNAL